MHSLFTYTPVRDDPNDNRCTYNIDNQYCLLLNILGDNGIAQSVEALYFTTELHTSSVRVRVQPGTKYLYGKKNLSECMWFGCRLPVTVVSQAYPGNAEICPGFPPPQAVLRIILSNEGDAV